MKTLLSKITLNYIDNNIHYITDTNYSTNKFYNIVYSPQYTQVTHTYQIIRF
jgi:hypothetical protein